MAHVCRQSHRSGVYAGRYSVERDNSMSTTVTGAQASAGLSAKAICSSENRFLGIWGTPPRLEACPKTSHPAWTSLSGQDPTRRVHRSLPRRPGVEPIMPAWSSLVMSGRLAKIVPEHLVMPVEPQAAIRWFSIFSNRATSCSRCRKIGVLRRGDRRMTKHGPDILHVPALHDNERRRGLAPKNKGVRPILRGTLPMCQPLRC